MIQNIYKNWNFFRVFRLAIGVLLMVEALKSANWFLVLVGAVFVLMPLLDIGCCATGNCPVPTGNSKATIDEVEYEEIK